MRLFRACVMFCWLGIFGLCAIRLEAEVDPVVVEFHYQNGIKFYKRGLYDKAIAEFEKTLGFDPARQDAQEYLEKSKAAQEEVVPVTAGRSSAADISRLYDEGKRLYRARDYQGALEVFNKILEKKPIDDFASFYRERCEILISRQIAKEKKSEGKHKARQEKQEQGLKRAQEREAKKAGNKEILKKRGRIRQQQKAAKNQEVPALEEGRLSPVPQDSRLGSKELFLQGVEHYGRGQYEQALASFSAVIETEAGKEKLYTNSAKRLAEKTRKKLELSQKKG